MIGLIVSMIVAVSCIACMIKSLSLYAIGDSSRVCRQTEVE